MRCNAWYGEKDSYDSVFYRCQKPKNHKGEHYYTTDRLRVYWKGNDREYYLLSKRVRNCVQREMRTVPIPCFNKKEQTAYLKIQRMLREKWERKYVTWRGWLTGGQINE